ncbi:hypothetical protein AB0A60_19810 [Streptomyces sp. NPDC046275]|uniref:hypothetical protein n=1 Tax=Streptomyces sp. NPDC046275 TaxID=3157201 RepID=UPI0033D6BFA8
MTTRYLTVLRFEEGGPAVTGEWTDDATALRAYRGWVGLYGSKDSVVIRLIEVGDGREHALKTWTAQGEADTAPE